MNTTTVIRENLDESLEYSYEEEAPNVSWLPYLRSWETFNRVEDEQLEKVNAFYSFSCTPFKRCKGGSAAIFVTADDDAYGIGHNCSSINVLGFAENSSGYRKDVVDLPLKIDGLSQQNLKDLSIGGLIGAAITGEGSLLWWGLCYESQGHVATPHKPWCVNNTRFRKVVCGYRMMVALSTTFQVFIWGNIVNNDARYMVCENLSGVVGMLDISCGLHHVAMLSMESLVYTFGRGNEGQRGLLNYEFKHQYIVTQLTQRPCLSVQCGPLSTFCQTKNLKVRGYGTYGQYRSLGTTTLNHVPAKPVPDKIIAITVIWGQGDSSILVASSVKQGQFYTWDSKHSTRTINAQSRFELYSSCQATPYFINLRNLPSIVPQMLSLKYGPENNGQSLET